MMKKFLLGASTIIGISALSSVPAFAYTLSGNDYLLYESNGTNTGINANADVDHLLNGNSNNPGGNIELFASSESVSLSNFLQSDDRTSIEGTVAGKQVVVSSLTAKDWFGTNLDTSYLADTFATRWFNAFYQESGLETNESLIKTVLAAQNGDLSWLNASSDRVRAAVYGTFLSDTVKGFQRTSDPNVSYIATKGSDLLIGLAGHDDLKAYYASQLGPLAALIKDGFQASEVVKVEYDGVTELLYSFNATESGLVEVSDNSSHDGNYEVKMSGVVSTQSVPEPSIMLGLVAVGGAIAASKRKSAR
ncbi:MAG: NF038130 family PEP-CTERM protein [Cyanobacteriota bacterium]|nr:NF038130 family PEP-CTERM protein [Cyanobacteriota bacterium]